MSLKPFDCGGQACRIIFENFMKILFIYSAAENIGIESLSIVLKSAGHIYAPAI